MKYQYFLIIFAFLLANTLNGQILSDKAEISLLTYDPVKEIYTIFGHSAIRVADPVRQMDIVYNYGMFDFDAPNFTLNFIKGKLNYNLGIQDYRQVVTYSDYRNQSLYEQVLDLDSIQKQAIFLFLQNNYKPENRYYLYDFFYDNCATRIRDILDTTLTTQLSYDKAAVMKSISFRDLLQEFTAAEPWLEFGIDLVLGLSTDQESSFENQMFLPKYLNESFAVATVTTPDTTKALVKSSRIVHLADSMPKKGGLPTPNVSFWILFILMLLLNIVFKNERFANIGNGKFIFITGLVGVIILVMWFGTDHVPTRNNLNVLWGMPLNLLAAFWIWRKTPKPIYFRAITVLNLLLLITFPILPQEFAMPVIPILLILILIGLRYADLPILNQFFTSKTV